MAAQPPISHNPPNDGFPPQLHFDVRRSGNSSSTGSMLARISALIVLFSTPFAVTLGCHGGSTTSVVSPSRSDAEIELHSPYVERRTRHATKVDERGPNPVDALPPRPAHWQEVVVPSGALSLKAWLASGSSAAANAERDAAACGRLLSQ